MCPRLQDLLLFPGPVPALLPEAWDPRSSHWCSGERLASLSRGLGPCASASALFLSAAGLELEAFVHLSPLIQVCLTLRVTRRAGCLSLLTHWVERLHRGQSCAHSEGSEQSPVWRSNRTWLCMVLVRRLHRMRWALRAQTSVFGFYNLRFPVR